MGFLLCSALQDAGVLGKGVVHKLLHAARLLLLGRLPQLVVEPLNPPANHTRKAMLGIAISMLAAVR